jgi:hypothetical protein
MCSISVGEFTSDLLKLQINSSRLPNPKLEVSSSIMQDSSITSSCPDLAQGEDTDPMNLTTITGASVKKKV